MKISIIRVLSIKKSKKEFICDCCSKTIKKGSSYNRGFATINNLSFEFFVCSKCDKNAFSKFDDDEYVHNDVLFNAYKKRYAN